MRRVSYRACVARVAAGEDGGGEGTEARLQADRQAAGEGGRGRGGRARAGEGGGGTLQAGGWHGGTRVARTPSVASTSTPWLTRRSRVARSPVSAALSNAISATACGDRAVIHCLSASRAHGGEGARAWGHGAGAGAGVGDGAGAGIGAEAVGQGQRQVWGLGGAADLVQERDALPFVGVVLCEVQRSLAPLWRDGKRGGVLDDERRRSDYTGSSNPCTADPP